MACEMVNSTCANLHYFANVTVYRHLLCRQGSCDDSLAASSVSSGAPTSSDLVGQDSFHQLFRRESKFTLAPKVFRAMYPLRWLTISRIWGIVPEDTIPKCIGSGTKRLAPKSCSRFWALCSRCSRHIRDAESCRGTRACLILRLAEDS